MKTVLVFDTEDDKGMRATIKIVEHLAEQYLPSRRSARHDVSFGKIEFIKTLRAFMKDAEELEDPSDGTSLRFAKGFADKVWKRKNKDLGIS
jgi:hypothetical protein